MKSPLTEALDILSSTETAGIKPETKIPSIAEINRLKKHVRHLENILLAKGYMCRPPCFICGYNGPSYFQSEVHPCAKRHHKLYKPCRDTW